MVAPAKMPKNKNRRQLSVFITPEAYAALVNLQSLYAEQAGLVDDLTQGAALMKAVLSERNRLVLEFKGKRRK